jgi:hypothetical protein
MAKANRPFGGILHSRHFIRSASPSVLETAWLAFKCLDGLGEHDVARFQVAVRYAFAVPLIERLSVFT